MLVLEARRQHPFNPKEWKQRKASDSDADRLIDEPCTVVENGKPLIVYREIDWDAVDLVSELPGLPYRSDFRTDGLKTTSSVFGYLPRITLRRDYCTRTALARDCPSGYNALINSAPLVDKLYRHHNPELYSKHDAMMQGVLSDWRIPGSLFTSGIVNRNNSLGYHQDAGNFSGVWSCMLIFTRGVDGGRLIVPELKLGFQFKFGTILMFDGQALMHGVTPITVKADGYRVTVVYYSLKAMCNCLSPSGELARIKKVKTEREHKRLGYATDHSTFPDKSEALIGRDRKGGKK